jgi:DNA-binding MarR family transcriptional regulator
MKRDAMSINQGNTRSIGKSPSHCHDDARRPVWLEATDSFYKKLNRIASLCELSRYEALSRGLDALRREIEVRNSALNRNIKSPGQSEVFRRTMGQVSRNYWATVSTEEKRERARKSANARWNRSPDGQ